MGLRPLAHRIAATTLVPAMLVVVAACGSGSGSGGSPAPEASGPLADLVARAQAEQSVTIYSTHAQDRLTDLKAGFEKAYGITVDVVRGVDADNIPRIETEHDTDRGVADVFVTTDQGWLAEHEAQAADWFVSPTGPAFDAPAYDKQVNIKYGGAFLTGTTAPTFGWNTDLYGTGLKDYAGLLDPQLAGGKIGVVDPSIAPPVVDYYEYLNELYGADFLTKLAAQKPRIYAGSVPMTQALTSGEIAAGVFVNIPAVSDAKDKGAPVSWGVADPAWGARLWAVIPKTSPHPNAAQLLADYMVSADGQQALNRGGGAVLPDIPGAATTTSKVRELQPQNLQPAFVEGFVANFKSMFGA